LWKSINRIAMKANLPRTALKAAIGATLLTHAACSSFSPEGGTSDNNSRGMTTGEVAMARTIFGDVIPYDKVRIYYRPSIFGGATAPDGNIYIAARRAQNIKDFSEDGTDIYGFMHEMTHVYQYYTGVYLINSAVKLLFSHAFNYNAAYDYNLSKDKKFSDYNIEQQAELVVDYMKTVNLLSQQEINDEKHKEAGRPTHDDPPERKCIRAHMFEKILAPVLQDRVYTPCNDYKPSATMNYGDYTKLQLKLSGF
ncbi:MAG: hypothetical protein K2X63_07620, partial [Burkholderiaceae bacterium]|nr:hypothetical protein [Burkholderiaceae bacterium]